MSPSIAELRAQARTPGARFTLDLMILMAGSPTYGEYCEKIDQAVDLISAQLAKHAQIHQQESEDQLSIHFVNQLRHLNFPATHDTQYGGHCDIVVEEGEFLWLGEAKIATDNSWVMKGYGQLHDRYTTGMAGQNKGSLILYVQKGPAKHYLDLWQSYLIKALPELTPTACNRSQLAFRTESVHPRSGLSFEVRHVAVGLFFK